jgi:hypothetical protein
MYLLTDSMPRKLERKEHACRQEAVTESQEQSERQSLGKEGFRLSHRALERLGLPPGVEAIPRECGRW